MSSIKITNESLIEALESCDDYVSLASYFGVDRSTITRYCKKWSIFPNSVWFKNLSDDEFSDLFSTVDNSCTRFENKYGTSYETVMKRVRKLGLEVKKYQEYNRIADFEYSVTEEDIREVYDSCQGIVQNIAKRLNKSHTTISSACSRYGIEVKNGHTRTLSESILRDLYVDSNGNGTLAASLAGVSPSLVNKYFRDLDLPPKSPNRSSYEVTLENYLRGLGVQVLCNYKGATGFEIDLYLPDFKIGIEVNGLYYHSERTNKGRNYHLRKTQECNEAGVRLIHLFEDEIRDKIDIVKAKVQHILGLSTSKRVYARKCKVVKETDTLIDFQNENHIYGYGKASLTYSLKINNEVVALMNFLKYSNGRYKLNRYCTSCVVPGGFSKLFSFFVKDVNPEYVETFADLRFTEGTTSVYDGMFVKEYNTDPGYFYTDGNHRKSRQTYMKSKLPMLFSNFDPNLSEKENCANNKLYRIWDVGHAKYIWRKHT